MRSQNRILILNVDQITSLRVDRGLVCAATAEGEFWTKYTALTELENQLDPQVFYRVHRQVIVNLNHVREINAFDNSTARLTLTGGQQVNVSRNHLPGLRQLLHVVTGHRLPPYFIRQLALYSVRSATTGSTFVALRAGK